MKRKWCAYIIGGCLAAGALGCGNTAGAGTASLTEQYRKEAREYGVQESSAEFKETYAKFALELLEGNRKGLQGTNMMVSPLSVMTALEMTRAGAAGDTLAQMDKTLYSGMMAAEGKEELMTFANRLPDGGSVSFCMADALWFRNDEQRFVPDESFLRTEAQEYAADIFSAAFDEDTCRDINRWVAENTKGRVREIVDEIPEEAILYLVNAVAFQGEWQEKYQSNQLQPAEFTCADGSIAEITMMYGEEQTYLENEDATGFVKPYKDGYAFVALLPREELSLDDYLMQLSGEEFLKLLAGAQDTEVDTGLPKFTAETGLELSEVLADMGMPLAFDVQQADFSAMGRCADGENICINRILHKTYIDVDEDGTKAAAATVVEMVSGYALVEEPKRVILDRPFLYAIIEEESGLPVFIGTVEAL